MCGDGLADSEFRPKNERGRRIGIRRPHEFKVLAAERYSMKWTFSGKTSASIPWSEAGALFGPLYSFKRERSMIVNAR